MMGGGGGEGRGQTEVGEGRGVRVDSSHAIFFTPICMYVSAQHDYTIL